MKELTSAFRPLLESDDKLLNGLVRSSEHLNPTEKRVLSLLDRGEFSAVSKAKPEIWKLGGNAVASSLAQTMNGSATDELEVMVEGLEAENCGVFIRINCIVSNAFLHRERTAIEEAVESLDKSDEEANDLTIWRPFIPKVAIARVEANKFNEKLFEPIEAALPRTVSLKPIQFNSD